MAAEDKTNGSKKGKSQILLGITIVSIGILATLPWCMYLESLRRENPQLSTSLLVQLIPLFLAFFVYGILKARASRKKK